MKKLALKTSSALAALSAFAGNAMAQSASFFDNPQGGAAPSAAAQGTLGQNITLIINYFLGILGLIAVAMLIYAGVLMVLPVETMSKLEKLETLLHMPLLVL